MRQRATVPDDAEHEQGDDYYSYSVVHSHSVVNANETLDEEAAFVVVELLSQCKEMKKQ